MSNEEHSETLISQWLDGQLSDEQVLSKISKEDFFKYKQILQEVDTWTPVNQGFLPEYEKIILSEKEAKVVKFSFQRIMLVAASLSLLILASVFYFKSIGSGTTFTAQAGEVKEIVLPDGLSKAFLAGGATLSWKSEDWSENSRNINLSGKGYFEIEKGAPFSIKLSKGSIEVLGTRFEVEEFYSNLAVICFEGKVKSTIEGKSEVISAGESWLFEDSNWNKQVYPDVSRPDWLQNVHSFKDASLLQVFSTLEATYGLHVHHKDINTKRKYTGTFPKDDLNLTLRIIFDPMDINYRLEGDELYLSN